MSRNSGAARALLPGQVWIGRIFTVQGRAIRITSIQGDQVRYEVLVHSARKVVAHTRARMLTSSLLTAYRPATEAEAADAEKAAMARERERPEPIPVRVDLTGQPDELTWAEVLTDAGAVRVYTGLVGTHDGQPHVVVEIDRNFADAGRKVTPAGGNWDVEVNGSRSGTRTDVTLERRP